MLNGVSDLINLNKRCSGIGVNVALSTAVDAPSPWLPPTQMDRISAVTPPIRRSLLWPISPISDMHIGRSLEIVCRCHQCSH